MILAQPYNIFFNLIVFFHVEEYKKGVTHFPPFHKAYLMREPIRVCYHLILGTGHFLNFVVSTGPVTFRRYHKNVKVLVIFK